MNICHSHIVEMIHVAGASQKKRSRPEEGLVGGLLRLRREPRRYHGGGHGPYPEDGGGFQGALGHHERAEHEPQQRELLARPECHSEFRDVNDGDARNRSGNRCFGARSGVI